MAKLNCISIYVDEKTKLKLRIRAHEEHRSLSEQIKLIIEKWMKKNK